MRSDGMKKLAILFPGVNYSVDCPLLYYAGNICENAGFEIYEVKYEGYGKAQTAAKASSLEECIKLEYEALKGKLPQDMLQEYEELLFPKAWEPFWRRIWKKIMVYKMLRM